MLAAAAPEIVVVLTPNYLHRSMTLAALEHGAHVICEKPLALNASEAREMLEMATHLQRRHLTFFTYRGLAATCWVKQLIGQGYLGRVHHANASYLHGSWLDPQRPASWKTQKATAGFGVLADLAAHVIDLLQWWLQPIGRVAASLQISIDQRPGPMGKPTPVETDDAAALVVEFRNGGQGLIQVSRIAPVRHNYLRVELYGSEGVLVLDYEASMAYVGRVTGARNGEQDLQPLEIPTGLARGLRGAGAFPELHARLTDGFFTEEEEGYPTFADGLAVQQVIDAAGRSAETGRWESVESGSSDPKITEQSGSGG